MKESILHKWNAVRFHSATAHGVCLLLCAALFGEVHAQEPAATRDQIKFFETKIRPVLVEHCYECHAAGAKIVQGGLRVDHREGLLRGGDWFARFTAALMLGAAVGGILLGNLGDRIGCSRAMGVSILFYSIFAMMGAWARTQEEMLVLRFMVGLGVGGVWPNGMALVAECWSSASRPLVTGVMSAGLNAGILLLSQVVRIWTVSPDSWRWLFYLGGLPALLGILVLVALPESPTWLANRNTTKQPPPPIRELFRPELIRMTLVAIIIASIPLVGAWSASKWMIPWADKVAGNASPGYKAATQGWWALGATLGSFSGAPLSR